MPSLLDEDEGTDLEFTRALPKIEVHAHLNGSLPPTALKELIARRIAQNIPGDEDLASFEIPELEDIDAFFRIFGSVIYRLTSTSSAITYATFAVLDHFRRDGCIYFELRTTPRSVEGNEATGPPSLSRREYVEAVLDGFRQFDHQQRMDAAQTPMVSRLILSVDRRHTPEIAEEIVDLAIDLSKRPHPEDCFLPARHPSPSKSGSYIVGVDLCGDVNKGDAKAFKPAFDKAKQAGLGITIHFGEIPEHIPTLQDLLSLQPTRLGHATFLTPAVQQEIIDRSRARYSSPSRGDLLGPSEQPIAVSDGRPPLAIEICISSNLACKTVNSLQDHHLAWALRNEVPVIVCTDDLLVFKNSPSQEYALALSRFPENRSKTKKELMVDVLLHGIDALFCTETEKEWLRQRILEWKGGQSNESI